MRKIYTAIGAAALLCASQANAAFGVYNEREPNDTVQQAEKIDYAFGVDDQQFIINFFGSLDTDTNFGMDWFTFDLPTPADIGVIRYNVSIFVEGLGGAITPDIFVVDLNTNRGIFPDFTIALGGQYAVSIQNPNAVAGGRYRANVVIDAIPEPTTWALMLSGFAMVGYAMRRRRPQVVYA